MVRQPIHGIGRVGVARLEWLATFRQVGIGVTLAACLGVPQAVAADDYLLAPGDVLRVMVVGDPELSVDVPIEMDGSAWFPLVGPIAAGGVALRDVRSLTAEAYATMSLSRPVARGGELPQIIDKSQVYVGVAAYRPIYVTGDAVVAHEIPFQAGLSLRHLLALASALPQHDGQHPATIGETEAAAAALAHEYAQIWRQKTILGTDTPEDFDRIFVAKGAAFDEIVAVERSILEETRAGLAAQKEHIRAEIARNEARIPVLIQQKANESEGLAMDKQTLDDVQDLFTRNLVPAARLTEVRRATLVTASRVFQIDEALETARGRAAVLHAELLTLDSDARIRASEDLGEAMARVQQRRSDFEALVARGQGTQQIGLALTEPKASVTRDGVTIPETPLSFALMPGDIVEIRLVPIGAGTPSNQHEANG